MPEDKSRNTDPRYGKLTIGVCPDQWGVWFPQDERQIDWGVALDEMAGEGRRTLRPFVEEFVLADDQRLVVLGEGRLINLAAAEGHPASVMDMSFANQALAAGYLVREGRSLERRVYRVPHEIDQEIARLKLVSMGIEIDHLTAAQEAYLAGWEAGTWALGVRRQALGVRTSRRHPLTPNA